MSYLGYKAISKKTKDWIYGSYVQIDGDYYFIDLETGGEGEPCFVDIDDNTVCLSTGMKDKNGIEIFENDIVRMRKYGTGYMETSVYFKRGKFAVDGSNYSFKDIHPDSIEVVGNSIK